MLVVLAGCDTPPPAQPPPPPTAAPSSERFAIEHAQSASKNPGDVIFEVKIADGRKSFALGEPIPLVLSFSSRVESDYELDLGAYDRSGRMWSESFTFERQADVVDPLADYFRGLGGGMGGLRPMPPKLGPKAEEVRIVLNEWVRFTGAGQFRFFVRSTRLSQQKEVPVVSNVVTVEIADDPAWAAAELKRLQQVLETDPDEDTERLALRGLRFLGTIGAAQAIVDRMCVAAVWQPFDLHAGLYGSPHRPEVITMLEKGIASPSCAVTQDYLGTLSSLKVGPRPADAETQKKRAQEEAAATKSLMAAVDKKDDSARAVSLRTLLTILGERRDTDPSAPEMASLRGMLAKVFLTLPVDALERVLGTEWASIKTPSLAPVLLALVEEARPRGGRLRSVSDMALERLVELDYDAAKTFILAELGRADGVRVSFSGPTLGLLRDAELPALDATFVKALQVPDGDGATLELRAEVFARYASKAVVKEAHYWYKAVPLFRMALLAFVVKHDPRTAAKEIAALPDFHSMWVLAKYTWTPELEKAVIGRLGTIDAHQASGLLASKGSAAAEKALWDRLRAVNPAADKHGEAQALRRAIAVGGAWITTPEKLKKLLGLCTDDMCKNEVRSYLDRWGEGGKMPTFVLWTQPTSKNVTGWIAQYDLRSVADIELRIGQMPEGTTLVLGTKAAEIDAEILAKVRSLAKARKITILEKES